MRPYFSYFIILVFVAGLSFWGGLEAGEKKWASVVVEAIKQRGLSDLRGCIFAIDSNSLRMVRRLDPKTADKTAWRIEQCDKILARLGALEQDEDTSRILGEAKLFYDGYTETLSEILATQIQLETLYNEFSFGALDRVRELEELQNKQIHESKKFLERLELLIGRAW